MKKQVGKNIFIDLNQSREKGTPWQVRVYKKVLGFRKRISSDWFLDELQARKFADHVAKELGANGSAGMLKQRKPGWTFSQPAR